MKEQEEPSSVLFDGTFKPPDRSTSAPPVLSLHSQSLFAFRAAEHLQLFSDIRCDENYFEFYKKYQNQDKLPPPLQTQPFLVDRSLILQEEEDPHPYERYSVAPEARSVAPIRPSSNPQYGRQPLFDGYDPSRLDDLPAGSPTNEAIWTPLPRKMANLVLDDYPSDEKHDDPRQRGRDAFYQNDFDVAYSTANQLLKEDNIQSLWNDRSAFERGSQPHYRNNTPMTAPTPTMPSQPSPLLSLLNNNINSNNISNNGKLQMNNDHYGFQERTTSPLGDTLKPPSPRRRSSSGSRLSIVQPPSATTPPLPNATTSPSPPICRYFAQGFCSRGDRCNFLHEVDPNTPIPTAPVPDTKVDNFPKAKPKKAVASPPPFPVEQQVVAPPKKPGLTSLIAITPTPTPAPAPRTPTAPRSNGLTELVYNNGIVPPVSPAPTNGSGSTTPISPASPALSSVSSPSAKADLVASRQYTSIDQVVGHIYSLCKDQHGCRFLQKKLEDRDPNVVEFIFGEVYDQMSELMTDPFGNYLCQKLLEHCDDQQRYNIIERVAGDLVKISKNMHGTRAVQKMIEFLTTPEQISIVKRALANSVVPLIQDLNGNHVIQRCLNRLSPADNQFIYDSVSQAGNCVEVATHRHGCCVLQRCIDHASDSQKLQLINEVIANALVLVQDPYGNYVVQYVLDLPFTGLASELARRFLGHIPILSTQKFSSNVIEKCLNVADVPTRAVLIQELVEYDNLLYLLQDPYANYVIQTSLNVSEPMQHARLVEAIRPHLAALRNTPYGKRIQNKILKESSRDYYT